MYKLFKILGSVEGEALKIQHHCQILLSILIQFIHALKVILRQVSTPSIITNASIHSGVIYDSYFCEFEMQNLFQRLCHRMDSCR